MMIQSTANGRVFGLCSTGTWPVGDREFNAKVVTHEEPCAERMIVSQRIRHDHDGERERRPCQYGQQPSWCPANEPRTRQRRQSCYRQHRWREIRAETSGKAELRARYDSRVLAIDGTPHDRHKRK